MGEYCVSIIHINSSTIAISVVEPQNDADTFINNCGGTGERPAIEVMNKLQLDEYTHLQKVKVYNGLLEFAVFRMLVNQPFNKVIREATKAANDADKSVVDYLAEFAIDDADIMDDGVIDDD